MDRRRSFVLAVAIAGLALSVVGAGFCAEADQEAGENLSGAETDMLWAWGEVVSVDPQRAELVIRHLNYDTDSEEQVTISVDAKTAFENVKGLSEIKPNDTVSVDYLPEGKGGALAKNISVEKPDTLGTEESEEKASSAAAGCAKN